jgi:phosphotriesterase-related protein
MPISSIAGKAQTVLGPVNGEELGVTLPHEHLTIDHVKANFHEPPNPEDKELADKPVTMDLLHWLRYYRTENKDNLRLPDEKVIINELMHFKKAGGRTIVEVTTKGSNRDPGALVHISKATGLNIIMGAGYYLGSCHPEDMDSKTIEQLTEEIIKDVTTGTDGTSVKAGIIGEIGCVWPLTPNEKKSLIAAAHGQKATGAPLNIHPGRAGKAPFEIVEILKNEGADLSRTVMSHVDIRIRFHEDRLKLADSGCYLEYDNIGWEGPPPATLNWDEGTGVPRDEERISEIMQLIDAGYINQILISLDVCTKTNLLTYGGKGYNHIQKYIVPMMLNKGMSQKQIDTIMIENPRRMLSFI